MNIVNHRIFFEGRNTIILEKAFMRMIYISSFYNLWVKCILYSHFFSLILRGAKNFVTDYK